MPEHAAIPWKLSEPKIHQEHPGEAPILRYTLFQPEGKYGYGGKIVCGLDFGYHETGGQQEATAAFIDRACNCHDDLMAVLEAIKTRLHFVGMPSEPIWEGKPDWRIEIELMEAAITKAEKKESEKGA